MVKVKEEVSLSQAEAPALIVQCEKHWNTKGGLLKGTQ